MVSPAFISYSERPEWADLTPSDLLCTSEEYAIFIAYSTSYKEAIRFFGAILELQEKSVRALQLCEDIIRQSSAHYTVWQYRREILDALKRDEYDFEDELKFVRELAIDNPKCFQLWHHRRVVIDKIGELRDELQAVEDILTDDNKNYHAWAYRHWLVERFALWQSEIRFADKMIKIDVRNNSAWNYRYFLKNYYCNEEGQLVRKKDLGLGLGSVEEKLKVNEEIDYVKEQILLAPNNESPWTYLASILGDKEVYILNWKTFEIGKFVEGILSKYQACSFALRLRVKYYEALCSVHGANNSCDAKELLNKDLNELVLYCDTIREVYWNWRQSKLSV